MDQTSEQVAPAAANGPAQPGRLAEFWGTRCGPVLYDPFLRLAELRGMSGLRRDIVARAHGRVLELGAGTGLNLRHYRAGLEELILTEPRRLRSAGPVNAALCWLFPVERRVHMAGTASAARSPANSRDWRDGRAPRGYAVRSAGTMLTAGLERQPAAAGLSLRATAGSTGAASAMGSGGEGLAGANWAGAVRVTRRGPPGGTFDSDLLAPPG